MDIIHNTSFLKRYLEKSLTCWGLIVEDKILLKGIKENIVEKNIMIMNGRLNIVKKFNPIFKISTGHSIGLFKLT